MTRTTRGVASQKSDHHISPPAAFKVPAVQFAVADDSNYTYSGVLGLGYTYGLTTKYPTLLSMMYMLGFVAAPIFSIGLGGEGDNFSKTLFRPLPSSISDEGSRRDHLRRGESVQVYGPFGAHRDMAAHQRSRSDLDTVRDLLFFFSFPPPCRRRLLPPLACPPPFSHETSGLTQAP